VIAILLNLCVRGADELKALTFPEAAAAEIVHVGRQRKRHLIARTFTGQGAALDGGVNEIGNSCP